MYTKIEITMKNGNVATWDNATWDKGKWDDYMYDDKFFIVKKNDVYVGFYNVDEIYSIVVS